MSVICWDGTTLAADRRASTGSQAYTVQKICRLGDRLVGFVGTANRMPELCAWLKKGAKPKTYQKMSAEDDSAMVVIHRNGAIHSYDGSPYPIVIVGTHFADGSGCDYARAALYLGCTAEKAVEVASQFDPFCGNGVDTLTFDAPKRRTRRRTKR
ncbi:MAG TPA: hypothetical protein VIK25_12710 [Gemmatimonadaceae bacterium]